MSKTANFILFIFLVSFLSVFKITFAQTTCVDIGLRIFNGTKTVTIQTQPQGTLTSPLRIAKNGIVYGIVLVNPGDPTDSGVRIETNSGIKALGGCSEVPCTPSYSCSAGSCVDDKITITCVDSNCGEPTITNTQSCTPDTPPCTTDAQCPSGQCINHYCHCPPLVGICGPATQDTYAGSSAATGTAPSDRLCYYGTPSTPVKVTYRCGGGNNNYCTGWRWTCTGDEGTTPTSCLTASPSVNGTCGPGLYFPMLHSGNPIAATAADFCSSGAPNNLYGMDSIYGPYSPNGPWAWSCFMCNGAPCPYCDVGATSCPVGAQIAGHQCTVQLYAHCGTASGVASTTAPTTGLCSIDSEATTAAVDNGNGFWTWICHGSAGAPGASPLCSAPKAPQNGACGPAARMYLPASMSATNTPISDSAYCAGGIFSPDSQSKRFLYLANPYINNDPSLPWNSSYPSLVIPGLRTNPLPEYSDRVVWLKWDCISSKYTAHCRAGLEVNYPGCNPGETCGEYQLQSVSPGCYEFPNHLVGYNDLKNYLPPGIPVSACQEAPYPYNGGGCWICSWYDEKQFTCSPDFYQFSNYIPYISFNDFQQGNIPDLQCLQVTPYPPYSPY